MTEPSKSPSASLVNSVTTGPAAGSTTVSATATTGTGVVTTPPQDSPWGRQTAGVWTREQKSSLQLLSQSSSFQLSSGQYPVQRGAHGKKNIFFASIQKAHEQVQELRQERSRMKFSYATQALKFSDFVNFDENWSKLGSLEKPYLQVETSKL